MKRCGNCGKGRLTRSHRTTFFEFLLSLAGVFPYSCTECKSRTFRARGTQLGMVSAGLILLVAAGLFARPQIHNLMRGRMPFPGSPQKALPERASVQPKPEPVAVRDWPTDVKPQDVLTNDTIVELLKSGMGAKLVSQLVQELPSKFDTSPAALIRLKQSNVPDELIETMIAVNSRAPRQAVPAQGR